MNAPFTPGFKGFLALLQAQDAMIMAMARRGGMASGLRASSRLMRASVSAVQEKLLHVGLALPAHRDEFINRIPISR